MKTRATPLPGVIVVEPEVFTDARGWLVESFQRDRYRAVGIVADIVQENRSSSVKNTIRGLHYRVREPQGKLVQVTRGSIYDVAVDVRAGSPTFRAWFGIELSEDNRLQLWIPGGYAHGFCATSDIADVEYKLTSIYDPTDERGIAWNDPELAIPWPLDGDANAIVSLRDRDAPRLRDAELPHG